MKRVKSVKDTLMMGQKLYISLINQTRGFRVRYVTCKLVRSCLYGLDSGFKVNTRLLQQSDIQSETWKQIPQLEAVCTKRKN